MQSDDITISCYESEVPSFVELEMERLYGNIFSSMLQFRVGGKAAEGASTYVARRGGRTVAIFLFHEVKGKVRVMNETILVSGEQLNRFASYIFATHPFVNIISFKAIETDVRRLTFPHQRYNHIEDMMLVLPRTVEEYAASLGKNARRNIKRYMKRLKQKHPSCRFRAYEKGALRPQHIREIIEFNRARMAGKNIVSIIDEEETERIIELIAACGLVGVITIDGSISAGAMSYQQGENYFLNVLAHRPDYDEYALGFLCCYLTICECIARGGKEFHFLWGRYDYKFALGAHRRDLDNVVIYRSRAQLLRNIDEAWKVACAGYLRKAKLWVKYDDNIASRFAREIVSLLRGLKEPVAGKFPAEAEPNFNQGREN